MSKEPAHATVTDMSPGEKAALEKYMSLPVAAGGGPNGVDIIAGDDRGFLRDAAMVAQPDPLRALDGAVRGMAGPGAAGPQVAGPGGPRAAG